MTQTTATHEQSERVITKPRELVSLVGFLQLTAPMHIGSGQGNVHADSVIIRDSRGLPYIPGSGIAGLLRDLTRRLAQTAQRPDLLTDIWGSETDTEDKTLSLVDVSDGILRQDQRSAFLMAGEVREHVGIRRDREVAREHIKFNREVAPQGLRFWFELQIGDPGDDECAMLDEVLGLLARRSGAVGGRSGTGLGRFELHITEVKRTRLDDASQFAAFLLDRADPRESAPDSGTPPRLGTSGATSLSAAVDSPALNWCRIDLRLDVVPGWPLLVKSERQHLECTRKDSENRVVPEAVDANFVRTLTMAGDGEWGYEVYIPGSDLRGALRSRAEKIIRTMADDLETPPEWSAACDPTCHQLASNSDGSEIHDPTLSCGERLRLEQITIDGICSGCKVFGCAGLASHVGVGEGVKVDGTFSDGDEKLLDHVAIDRFTGGPVGHKKFTSRPLMTGQFTTSIIIERFEPWELGLVAYLLKDLHEADLRVGYGKYKGFGKVQGVVTGFHLEAAPGSFLAALAQDPAYGLEPDPQSTHMVSVFRPMPVDENRQAPTGPSFVDEPDSPLGRLLVCCAHQCDTKLDELRGREATAQ